MNKMNYCNNCVYPFSTVNLHFDKSGLCSSCKMFSEFKELTDDEWKMRKDMFVKIFDEYREKNKSNYDCLIPVSGGKDSYYQTHIIVKELGLKPLLVTYHGNNFYPEGDHNRDQMRNVFNADHIVWGPSVEVLKKLNRLGFKKMGDMNWQNHCGVFTAPIRVAVQFNIPLIIWGEVNWDISGMFGANDFLEFSARVRHEHGIRGYEWYDFLDDPVDKLSDKDMQYLKYPSDEEILKVGARGLYIGNYFKWDPNAHAKMVQKKYGWKPREVPFERTYRQFSNIDDRYESGIHDLMKFVKFGYGRCSDHASKDIRTGYMTRAKGVEMVKKYDHVVSSDLYYWLDYVEMKESEFWEIADTFRDSNVWWIKNGEWWKDNVWGDPSSYGNVHLNKEDQKKYKKK